MYAYRGTHKNITWAFSVVFALSIIIFDRRNIGINPFVRLPKSLLSNK